MILSIPYPTRLVPSGDVSLAAGASQDFLGEQAKQKRVQFVITNKDATNFLTLQATNGTAFATVYALKSLTFFTAADIRVLNPSGTDAVVFQMAEFFPDLGGAGQAPAAPGQAGGGFAQGGDGGGVPGGGGGDDGGGGYSGGLHQGQLP